MKKTSNFLSIILGIMLILAVVVGVSSYKVYADTDDDYQELPDVNSLEDEDDEDDSTNNTVVPKTSGSVENNTVANNTTENNTVANNTIANNTTNNTTINNTTNNTTNNVTNNTTNNISNPTNKSDKDYPQTGSFVNGKIIVGVSIAAFAIIFTFAKLKKYSY
jgi:ABC-type antimicrobial peptide transport system permease subunit